MAQEIEKKFLVINNDFKKEAFDNSKIIQGYLSSVPERAVRIRIRDEFAFITVKGIGNQSGASRFEWEKEIPVNEAEELLKLCEPGIIDKTRYKVKVDGGTFEVDEFHGENDGLIVAEMELTNEHDHFDRPNWLGEEVTGKTKYYNAMLMKLPFTKW